MSPDRPTARSFRPQLGLVLFALLLLPALLRDPVRGVLAIGEFAVVAVAVVFVTVRFRRWELSRVPERVATSPSRLVRFTTNAASAYAVYIVGFYMVIAVLLAFTVIGHFL